MIDSQRRAADLLAPDAEAGICEHLGVPVPDRIRRAQALWRAQP